ncbi:uncharacterized protein LOC101463462 isoform X2 [Ceratitis capitata]|uniref:(Mediterranean fruit fly) hypothetical protein n=1 Tax=Ceratitis capitata TaxID=7213 RepID=A0A811V1B7_CERCA|nr:uncharacterized protein LOC101463462 isoform X2 [Ceratitis capitata]XP_023159339.1 uncharacterized protein LOC101463462 isoform X2 [Ceratitis capitata]CAD7004734.1 unnamed protein product [Ceratitis capitata]
MKIPFLSSSAPKEPEPISYATEFRDFLSKNAPLDFETKMARARPFIFASFIAWPAYWIYRGMDWSNRAHVERSLVTYINRTFHHAKLMQFAILGMGLMFAVYEESPLLIKVNHMLQGIDDEDYRPNGTVMD